VSLPGGDIRNGVSRSQARACSQARARSNHHRNKQGLFSLLIRRDPETHQSNACGPGRVLYDRDKHSCASCLIGAVWTTFNKRQICD
jgi:hypothetical protein